MLRKRIVMVVAVELLMVVVGIVLFHFFPEIQYKLLVRQAQVAEEQEDLEKAIALYEKATKWIPWDYEAINGWTDIYLAKAEALYEAGKYEEAWDEYERIYANNPECTEVYKRKADIYLKYGQVMLALEELQRAGDPLFFYDFREEKRYIREHTVMVSSEEIYADTPEKNQYTEYTFDVNGNEIKRVSQGISATYITEKQYDEENQLLASITMDENGIVVSEEKHEYNESGEETYFYCFSEDSGSESIKRKFYANGTLLEEMKFKDEMLISEYQYNFYGNETKIVIYDAIGNVAQIQEMEYQYNKQGKATECTRKFTEKSNAPKISHTKYYYDNAGNCIYEECTIEGDETDITADFFPYYKDLKYDEKGNLTECNVLYDAYGGRFRTTTYEYHYLWQDDRYDWIEEEIQTENGMEYHAEYSVNYYDGTKRLEKIIYPDYSEDSYEYYGPNNQISRMILADGYEETYDYDLMYNLSCCKYKENKDAPEKVKFQRNYTYKYVE